MTYERELEAALGAARLAGQAILSLYATFQRIADAPAEVTTEADLKSQEIIIDYLRHIFPADSFCAEETSKTLADLPKGGSRTWVVDPIDGTRGFARKNGEFSVMVGLLHDLVPVVGVVLEPARDRLTYAARGAGCFRQDSNELVAVSCRVTDTSDLGASVLTQSRSHKDGPPSPELRALHPVRTLETYSAGIKLALVARGEADIYLNTYPAFHDWDVCAGHALVVEAGGKATLLRGQDLGYGKPDAKQVGGLIASNGRLHAAALAALASVSSAR
jgi:3'(2'), 5'-bisphosphate nucleotidase